MSISNWFSRKFLTELALDATNRSRSFHSLRHTVVTYLTNKQVFPYFVKELVGINIIASPMIFMQANHR